jgi:GT2 family glycosyltransferase/glycosyltransferase involved in cell wall biosynthesis
VDSVLAHTAGTYRLLLIDDASPDPAIRGYFAALAARGLSHVVLLANERNLGFTGTANRGMRESRGDVVLLNSDTIVTPGWLEALRRCVASDPHIGTATPFSNNAEICSFPRFCADNAWLDGSDPEPIRRALARAAVPTYPELPTGVGFCLYIRRTLIDAIGPFDPVFEPGYGEENDFCMRAIAAGFRNVLCDDAFVVHAGERSFDGRKIEFGARNMERLLERHPRYLDIVHAFIAADPLRALRDAAQMQLRAATATVGVLHVIHNHGGGTEHHVRALIDASRTRHRHYLAIAHGDSWQVEEHADDGDVRTFEFERTQGEAWRDFIGALAATLRIALVHLHNISGCRDGILEALPTLGLPYGYTVHDLNFCCPTITFLGPDEMFCGVQTDAATCTRCLATQPAFGHIDIVAWRERHRRLLADAQFIIAPSQWTATTLRRYFPEHAVAVIPHGVPGAWAAQTVPDAADSPAAVTVEALDMPDDAVPTVAVLGAIGPDKGARRLDRMVELVRSRGHAVRFVLIGYLDRLQVPWQSDDAVFTIHGRYKPQDLPRLLAHYRVRLVAYPSAGPETFSLTLSESWAAGYPALVPPIGALAERVANSGAGWVMDEAEWRDDAKMLERIVALVAPGNAAALAATAARARERPQPTPDAMATRTLAIYEGVLATARDASSSVAKPFTAARVRDALGYVPWTMPAPTAVAAASDEALAPRRADDLLAWVARTALRYSRTLPGRVLRRITPVHLLKALKARLR